MNDSTLDFSELKEPYLEEDIVFFSKEYIEMRESRTRRVKDLTQEFNELEGVEEYEKDVRRERRAIIGSMQSGSYLLKLEESRRTRRMKDLTTNIREHIAKRKQELRELEEPRRTRRMNYLTKDIREHKAEMIQELRELEEPRRTRRMDYLTIDIREHIAEMKRELRGMKDNLKCVSPPQLIK